MGEVSAPREVVAYVVHHSLRLLLSYLSKWTKASHNWDSMSSQELFVLTDFFPLVETANFYSCNVDCQTAADSVPVVNQISPIPGQI